ncbi:MAG TPA: hypothetical protein PKD84_01320 [Propionicimonas sp.]|nr:hypothetical protein [Propionicimonas sp.]
MASWTDGPEYAPTVRPTAFVAPVAGALVEPEPRQQADDAVPDAEPTFEPPTEPAPDLRELVPSAAPGRNPNLPFETITTPITATEDPPSGPRDPRLPFAEAGPPLSGYLAAPVQQPPPQVNPAPFPAPGTPQWFVPDPSQLFAPPPQVTIGQIWKAATNWVMIPLLIGMFFAAISPVALLVATVSTTQIVYRRKSVRKAAGIIWGVALALTVLTVFADPTAAFYDTLAIYSLVGSWAAAIAALAIVGSALRNGEPPDQL